MQHEEKSTVGKDGLIEAFGAVSPEGLKKGWPVTGFITPQVGSKISFGPNDG